MALPRSAGILIPLFSLRTREDLGRGEILDLKSMIDFALAIGHRVIQLLPIDETSAEELSPYSALSVFAIDPIYISAHALDGVGPVVMKRARKAVGASRVVPRAIARGEKLKLLERAFRASRGRSARSGELEKSEGGGFEAFVAANRDWLEDYALFRALKERFEWMPWEQWPEEIARRDPDALTAARRDLAGGIAMYIYWQFLAHRQWTAMRAYATSRGALLGGDLAFSPGRDSAEVWANQATFDLTRTVGAPPDAFNPLGQLWGLPMPNWERMRAQDFRFWRARARRASALYDLIRIDHVVGLYRTYNFGPDAGTVGEFTPANEDEQRAQGEEVIRAIKTEVGATEIIAEDLGTVPPWVRESLTAMGVPGYKVMQWERTNWDSANESYISPAAYPELSLATTGTHDTEALTVWWREQPEAERARLLIALGIEARVNPRRLLDEHGLDAILGALYAAPARLLIMPMQDLFGWSARINRPGTVRDSNWTWRLPLTIERLRESPPVCARVEKLRALATRTHRY